MMSGIDLHKFAGVAFGITQKTYLHYIIKLGQIIDKKKNFFSELVLCPEERLVTSSRPLLFMIILSIKRDWVRKKKQT